MTTETNPKTLYERLREHYTGMPQRKEVVQILKLKYTPEEAELALSIPMIGQGWISLEELAEKVGKGEAEVWSMLESLLAKGNLYMERRDDESEVYCLWKFPFSLLTAYYGDGLIDDTKRQVAKFREKIWNAGSYLDRNSTYPTTRMEAAKRGKLTDAESVYLALSSIYGLRRGGALPGEEGAPRFCGEDHLC